MDWEENWLGVHDGHALPGGEEEDGDTRFGPLPDEDEDPWPEVDGEGSGHLLMCCGSERPRKTETKFQLIVTATGAGARWVPDSARLPGAGASVVDGSEGGDPRSEGGRGCTF